MNIPMVLLETLSKHHQSLHNFIFADITI